MFVLKVNKIWHLVDRDLPAGPSLRFMITMALAFHSCLVKFRIER